MFSHRKRKKTRKLNCSTISPTFRNSLPYVIDAQGFASAAASLAANLNNVGQVRQIERGPYGGTQLSLGDQVIGETLSVPSLKEAHILGCVRILDYSLAQTAYSLSVSPSCGYLGVLECFQFESSYIGRDGNSWPLQSRYHRQRGASRPIRQVALQV